MANPFESLWRMVQSRAPLGVVIYGDHADREEWVTEVRELLGDHTRVASGGADVVGDLCRASGPIILKPEPETEQETVEHLAVGRDRLLGRKDLAVLFLRREGHGLDALKDQPALASFLQGDLEVDPSTEELIDVGAERTAFRDDTELWPEDWLTEYRKGRFADTLDTALLRLRALLIEDPP